MHKISTNLTLTFAIEKSLTSNLDCFHLLQLASSDLSGQSGSLSHLQCGAMQLVWLNLYSEHVNSPESQSGAAEIEKEAERE